MTLPVVNKILIELRDDPGVAALVGNRVRTHEPDAGDIQPEGSYKAFIVLAQLGAPRLPGALRLPFQTPRIAARCYGSTPTHAAQVWGAVVDALHGEGPRIHANGLGIYQTFDTTGGSDDADPDTKQPVMTGVILAVATTQAVV